jgi:hypothetical protein
MEALDGRLFDAMRWLNLYFEAQVKAYGTGWVGKGRAGMGKCTMFIDCDERKVDR